MNVHIDNKTNLYILGQKLIYNLQNVIKVKQFSIGWFIVTIVDSQQKTIGQSKKKII